MALFFGGIPTRMDVDKLLAQIKLEAGKSVSYADVEKIIGIGPKEARFRTVTSAWRRRIFRERLLQSLAEAGAFVFLTADEAHDHARKSLSRVGRASGRLRLRVETIDADALTGERRDKHNLLRRETQAMVEAVEKARRTIAEPPKPQSTQAIRLAK